MKISSKICTLLIVFCISFALAQEAHVSPGFHYGIGISAFRGHRALQSLSFGPNAIKLYPSLSASVGAVLNVKINKSFSFMPELQYTLYRAYGEITIEDGTDFSDLNVAGVEMHSLELPMLARFNFGSAYAEIGPQVGANVHAKIYMNNDFKKPNINTFAFGPSIGAGINIKNISIGLRGHFGLLEYAKKTDGYPWSAQISLTSI